MDNNEKKTKEKLASFIQSQYSKPYMNQFQMKLQEHYGSDDFLRSGLGVMGNQNYGRSNQTLAEKIKNAKDADELRVISNESRTHQGYADIIDFYRTMFYYRYTVVPIRKDLTVEGVAAEDLRNLNYEMLEIVESASLEAILPNILESGLYNGFTALYIEKNGKGVSTYLLPVDYCRPFLATNYGTTTVVFDLSYFDDLLNSLSGGDDVQFGKNRSEESKSAAKEQEKDILALFPKEIVTAYKSYKGYNEQLEADRSIEKGNRYIQLDNKKAAIIPFSSSMAPPKIKALAAEERYESIAEVSAKKDSAGLEKIFTHKLPINEHGELAITIPEAATVQKGLQNILSGDANIRVVTTLGETQLLEVQKSLDERSTIVNDAFDSQYMVSGINPEMFRANTDYALSISLARNSSFVWAILQKIMIFYNLSINEQFKFGNYTCSITLLPINVYNEANKVGEYRASASFGIGRLDAIVAAGQKQIALYDQLDLEDALELDTRLTPLQSSHTQSSKDVGVETTDTKSEPVKAVKQTKQENNEVKDV